MGDTLKHSLSTTRRWGLLLVSSHHLSLTLVMDKKPVCLSEILQKHQLINSLSEQIILMMDYPPAIQKQKYLQLKVTDATFKFINKNNHLLSIL